MARINGWPFALPPAAIVIAVTATLAIGAVAGLYPAIRAARTPPTAGLSS
jgi:putative ABC transport system permease protein